MKDSYLTAGITLGQLLRLLHRNKLDFNAKTIFRLAFLFQGACWSSFFSTIEKRKYSKAITDTKVPEDPVFIIGHWRTGSTFLHQLMCLDSQFHAPTLFQVAMPDSFLSSYRFYQPLFNKLVTGSRPMDQVKIGMNEPQEDEYAIYRITSYSPLEHLVFPRSAHYFLDQNTEFLPPREKLGQWKSDLQDFYRKLHFFSHKRIISKNPFNSFRIDLLQEMFPKAKFINIIRNPLNVVPSTINMWDIIGKQNTLAKLHVKPSVDEVITFYDRLLSTVEQAKNQFIPGAFTEIRYEDLERDPVTELAKLYQTLNLSFTPEHKEKLNEFVKSASQYKKNTFQLDENDKQVIRERLSRFMEKKNYQ